MGGALPQRLAAALAHGLDGVAPAIAARDGVGALRLSSADVIARYSRAIAGLVRVIDIAPTTSADRVTALRLAAYANQANAA